MVIAFLIDECGVDFICSCVSDSCGSGPYAEHPYAERLFVPAELHLHHGRPPPGRCSSRSWVSILSSSACGSCCMIQRLCRRGSVHAHPPLLQICQQVMRRPGGRFIRDGCCGPGHESVVFGGYSTMTARFSSGSAKRLFVSPSAFLIRRSGAMPYLFFSRS